jgi:prevent-host-death family protein
MAHPTFGLVQARRQLPHMLAEAHAGSSTLITRHGKPVAVVAPVRVWQSGPSNRWRHSGILSLRCTGRGLWRQGASRAVAELRDE